MTSWRHARTWAALAATLFLLTQSLSQPSAAQQFGNTAEQSGNPAQQRGDAFTSRMTEEQVVQIMRAWNDDLPFVPGELLVKFEPGSSPAAQTRAVTASLRGADLARSRWIGDVLLVATDGEPDAAVAAAMLERQPEVQWAQPNYLRRRRSTPNDPSYTRQWNMDLIGMPRAWDINDGGTSTIKIAVLDSGVTTVNQSIPFPLWTGSRFESVSIPFTINPDIAAARILPGRDFVFWDGAVLDMDGHGTHVAGTVLQETNNSRNLAGIAYRASLMPLKICLGYWDLQLLRARFGIPGFVDVNDVGFCLDSATAQAIRYAADNGAQIINISSGGIGEAPIVQQALQYAVDRGVFVALAGGNSFEEGNPVEYPAGYGAGIDGVATVGAVNRSRRRAPYSSTGTHIELAAPGGDFNDGGIEGLIFQVIPFILDFDPTTTRRPSFNRFTEWPSAGTSMSAPHVAGLAALLYSQGITKPAAIEAAMKAFAEDLGTSGRDNEFGYGLIDARATLRGMGLAK
jgi:serine protease